MSLSKFLKSDNWVDLCFWLCVFLVPLNVFVVYMGRSLGLGDLERLGIMSILACGVGVVANYLRAKKPKA